MNMMIKLNDRDRMLSMIKPGYRTEAGKFLTYCEHYGYSLESFRGFIEMLKPIYSVSTVNKSISAVKALIRKIVDSPDLTQLERFSLERSLDEVKHLKIADKSVDADRVLSEDEMEQLISQSPKRTALIMRLLAKTGLRISEAVGIRLDRCTVNGTVKIRVLGKGGKERTVRISRELYREIRQEFDSSTYLFESKSGNPLHDRNVAKEVRRLGHKVLGRNVTPHMFRHSFAQSKINSTGKIDAVSRYLGHSTAKTTLDLYTHNQLTDDELGI